MTKKKSDAVAKLDTGKATALVKTLAQLPGARGLSKAERKGVYAISHNVSDALIQSVANLAADNGGSILGMGFDVEEARRVLAYASECKAVVDGARAFAQRVKDDVLQRRQAIAEHANVVYQALGRLVRTPEGKHLVHAFEQMHAEVARKRPRRAKRTSRPAANAAAATAPVTAPSPQPS